MNLRPSGYEPDELPGCSTPRLIKQDRNYNKDFNFMSTNLVIFFFAASLAIGVLSLNIFHSKAAELKQEAGLYTRELIRQAHDRKIFYVRYTFGQICIQKISGETPCSVK